MAAAPVELGSILFTLVEPHRDHAVAYNRWYERDHFYAGCMVGPGILAGRRWVATRPYKDVRHVEPGAIALDASTGSYLATYWISREGSRDWGRWAAAEVHRLHEVGRMFEHRDHVHTKMYRYEGGAFRDPDGVPPELALDHPFRGIAVVIGETVEPVERPAVLSWYRDRSLAGTDVAMTLAFTPIPIPADAPADVPRAPDDDRRFLVLSFLDAEPAAVWEAAFAKHAGEVAATGLARVVWAGPFIPTIPGTDTYTGDLW